MADYNMRPAVEGDCEEILRLIQELAVYENMPEQVKMTIEKLRRDGFGEQKFFHCLVVEDTTAKTPEGKAFLWGYALYYFTYSTWEGRVMYLEDLYMSPTYRGRGTGTKLFQAVTQVGVEKDCQRMQWVVLNWNKPSIDFYKSRGAWDVTAKENWNIFRMDRPELEQLSKAN
ncbi:diamine acetyltransferase 2-like [Mizuhopecten yessoensis]|uniref:Diamine acetyltransferase 2 n=1 Tax=Mizuhopecten yessoensis TaxID=6573 RepID=A0A210Q6T2_MIZYE|nr:diamine acetyltransferase 2-like [Mizuhopecten yessoensis]OWF44448.1 Diamine acetyltransferase 2 [Mizuhopecten yessoensis]